MTSPQYEALQRDLSNHWVEGATGPENAASARKSAYLAILDQAKVLIQSGLETYLCYAIDTAISTLQADAQEEPHYQLELVYLGLVGRVDDLIDSHGSANGYILQCINEGRRPSWVSDEVWEFYKTNPFYETIRSPASVKLRLDMIDELVRMEAHYERS